MPSWKNVSQTFPSFRSSLDTMRGVAFGFLFLITTMSTAQPSTARFYAVRLQPHEDLKKALMAFALTQGLEAAAVVSAVGSLEQYHLRFANQESGVVKKGHFEVLSLSGTLSRESCHLHVSLGDSTGQVVGGHLLDDNIVYTTMEIVLVELTELEFNRVVDKTYGYPELQITPRQKRRKK